MNLQYYQIFFFVFIVNFKEEALANILGKGKDVCGGDGVVIIESKDGCKIDEGKLKVAPLLEPVGDLCHKKEIIVKPAQCAKSAFAIKEEVKPFSFPDFPVDINSALPVPLFPPPPPPPPVNCDPSQNPACPPQLIIVLPPPPMLPMPLPEYMPQAPPLDYPPMIPLPPFPVPPLPAPPVLPPPPSLSSFQFLPLFPLPAPEIIPVPPSLPSYHLPPVQTQIPSPLPPPASDVSNYQLPRCSSCSSQPTPCPSCMAKAHNLQQSQQILPESSLQSLPRCSSCSSQPSPCPSCMAKAQNLQQSQQILPESSLQSLPRCSSCSSQPSPCPSCMAKAQNLQPPQQVLPGSSLQSLPRCSSCAGSPSPCSSCASKALSDPGDRSLTEYSYYPVGYPEVNFIPADAVSQQLAYKAKQEEKIKIEGEIAYGFKTLPIELDQIMPSKERYPEESLFQFNGQVLEFVPEKLVYSKAFDPYRGSEVLVAAKVPTPTKKLSLPEIGFGPVIVEPPPYIKKDY